MTNREWLLNEMQNMSDEEFAENFEEFCMKNEEICKIMKEKCDDFNCNECLAYWLKSEHKEKITLSEAERIILENIDKDYKWIARDKDGDLYIFVEKPIRRTANWDDGIISNEFCCYKHLFQFITWEDTEAYNIEELLKGG